MNRDRPSPNHDPRPDGLQPSILLLHYTGMVDAAAALARLTDAAAKVSAHYLIDEAGEVWQLVDEARRAWHAGRGAWAGCSDVNSASIGIELVNPGHEYGYRRFPSAQMAALTSLARAIIDRYAIAAGNVIGHSDMAPTRKEDPGEWFDWRGLAAAGIGLWSDAEIIAGPLLRPFTAGPAVAALQRDLARLGYECPVSGAFDAVTRAVAIAFQRHFRPERLDGVWDAICAARLADLLRQAGR